MAFRDFFFSNSQFWSRADKVRSQDLNRDVEILTITEILLVRRLSREYHLHLDKLVLLAPLIMGCIVE